MITDNFQTTPTLVFLRGLVQVFRYASSAFISVHEAPGSFNVNSVLNTTFYRKIRSTASHFADTQSVPILVFTVRTVSESKDILSFESANMYLASSFVP